MADLTTYTNVEAELAETAGYDDGGDLSMAIRRRAALRRKLDFAEQSDENGREIRFNHQIVESQLNQVGAYIQSRANDIASDAERLANPNVLHADFSGFGGYQ